MYKTAQEIAYGVLYKLAEGEQFPGAQGAQRLSNVGFNMASSARQIADKAKTSLQNMRLPGVIRGSENAPGSPTTPQYNQGYHKSLRNFWTEDFQHPFEKREGGRPANQLTPNPNSNQVWNRHIPPVRTTSAGNVERQAEINMPKHPGMDDVMEAQSYVNKYTPEGTTDAPLYFRQPTPAAPPPSPTNFVEQASANQ